jgi:uncharacterized protein YndB with AHSA1/START domain
MELNMMTDTSELQISMPTDREVVLTRIFDAPPRLVFDALTRPALIARWQQAPGRTLEVADVDLRVGGAYRFVWRGPGRKDVGLRGVYREVAPPERLVTVETWEDWDAGETLATTVLSEENGKTRYTSTIQFPSKEVRDTVLKHGFARNVHEQYATLAEVLASA